MLYAYAFTSAKLLIFPVLPQKNTKNQLIFTLFLHNSILITNFAAQNRKISTNK